VRLPASAHTSQPWRIHELTRDFRLEDVWSLSAPGTDQDCLRAVELVTALDPAKSSSVLVRALFALRWKIGGLLGWDEPRGPDADAPTLRERLPGDLRERPGPEFGALPFTSLYLLDDEFAAELANQTMHGVLHIGLAPDGHGGHRGQMAVLVKPNGLLGRAYMTAIKPFRHLIVYPAMLREFEREWHRRALQPSPPAPAR
jgi:hypothetical protein